MINVKMNELEFDTAKAGAEVWLESLNTALEMLPADGDKSKIEEAITFAEERVVYWNSL
jgi:hypothetical protein